MNSLPSQVIPVSPLSMVTLFASSAELEAASWLVWAAAEERKSARVAARMPSRVSLINSPFGRGRETHKRLQIDCFRFVSPRRGTYRHRFTEPIYPLPPNAVAAIQK